MQKNTFSLARRALFMLSIGLFLLLSRGVVHAQETMSITIVPPKLELFSNPGSVINETIKIKNGSNIPRTYSIVVEDFRAGGEEGHVVLEQVENSSYSLQSWIALGNDSIVVQPNEEVIFPFSINIPRNAEPGGHYASILFQVGSGDNIPGVTSVQHRVGALVLLRVSGDVVEESAVESFDIEKYSKSGPVPMNLRIKNNGTAHVRPQGTIVVSNIFGKKVAEIPLNGLNVFPGAVRKMETVWEKENLLGYYNATVIATYGQQSLPLTASVRFLVMSNLAAGLIIGSVIALYVFITSAIKGKNRILKAIKIIFTGN